MRYCCWLPSPWACWWLYAQFCIVKVYYIITSCCCSRSCLTYSPPTFAASKLRPWYFRHCGGTSEARIESNRKWKHGWDAVVPATAGKPSSGFGAEEKLWRRKLPHFMKLNCFALYYLFFAYSRLPLHFELNHRLSRILCIVSRVQTPGYVPKKKPLFGYIHLKKPTPKNPHFYFNPILVYTLYAINNAIFYCF